MNLLPKIARFVDGCAHRFRLLGRRRNDAQVRVDLAFELRIGKELSQLRAADFSLPLAQRALQAVAIFGHDFVP
jgi:hypothetical protein